MSQRPRHPVGAPTSLVLASLLLATGCAGAWKRYETKHVNLYTDMSLAHEQTVLALEYHYAIMASSFFGKIAGPKVDVLLLDDVPFRGKFGSYRTGMTLAKSPGGQSIGSNGLIVMRLTGSTNYGSTLLSYWFLDKAAPRAPLWFHEGFGRYTGGALYMEGPQGAAGCIGRFWSQKDDVLMSVNDFGNASWSEYADKYRGWLPYSGAVFFDWLMHADNGAHRGALGDVVNQLANGVQTSDALTQATHLTTAQIDEALKLHRHTWVPRGMCPLGFTIKPEALADKEAPRQQDFPPGPVDELLAALATLPDVEGYADYYPAEIVDQSGKTSKRRR